ncbi:MAG: hypothetical protein ACREC0_05570 [Methylocella sp.]
MLTKLGDARGAARQAATGLRHHSRGRYLSSYASEMAWREDNCRVRNGEQSLMAANAVLKHPVSCQWNGYRADAWPKKRSLRDCRQRRGGRLAAMGTTEGETTKPPCERLDGRKLDLVIFADQLSLGVRSNCFKAMKTMRGSMILEGVWRFA